MKTDKHAHREFPSFSPTGHPNEAMRRIAVCPACWSSQLEWDDAGAVCPNCTFTAPFRGGCWMPVVPGVAWRTVIQDTVVLFNDFVENRDAVAAPLAEHLQAQVQDFAREHAEDRDKTFLELWDRLPVPLDSSILEIGAGDLRTSSVLVRRGHHLVVLDPVPEFLGRGHYDAGLQIPKVCCSSDRIPFADGSFDVCFCQAALHHLDSIEPVVSEMGRVVRRGGLVVIFTEPYSAAGSNTQRIREHAKDVAFDMGLNEQLPRFSTYRNSLTRAGVENVTAHSPSGEIRPAEKLRRLGLPVPFGGARHDTTSGARSVLRHALSHGTVSLWGTRDSRHVKKPSLILPSEFPFPQEDYTGVRYRSKLVDIWKRLAREQDFPGAIVAGVNDLEHLRRGFVRADGLHSGRTWRWLQTQGACFLRAGENTKVVVECSGPPAGGNPWRISAWADDMALGEQAITDNDQWGRLEWKLPTGTPVRIEFRLRADHVEVRGGTPVSVRVASISVERQ